MCMIWSRAVSYGVIPLTSGKGGSAVPSVGMDRRGQIDADHEAILDRYRGKQGYLLQARTTLWQRSPRWSINSAYPRIIYYHH